MVFSLSFLKNAFEMKSQNSIAFFRGKTRLLPQKLQTPGTKSIVDIFFCFKINHPTSRMATNTYYILLINIPNDYKTFATHKCGLKIS